MFEGLDSTLLVLTVYGAVILISLWVAMIVWAFRDMRARSRDLMAQILVAIMVAILNVPGLFIYILMRPRETLSEAYERSLEEEALLQEIEEKPTCPGCAQRVQHNWQACPHCHTRLKKPCINCGNMLELSWTLCPYCAAAQATYTPPEAVQQTNHRPMAERRTRTRESAPRQQQPQSKESLEFIEGEEY